MRPPSGNTDVIHKFAAEFLVLLHCAFVAFVVLGALLVLRWPRLMWAHLPAVAWGAISELFGIVCPLTPLEQSLWLRAGEAGYRGGFVEHYLVALLYPTGLTRPIQIGLGAGVVIVNLALYAWLVRHRRRRAAPALE